MPRLEHIVGITLCLMAISLGCSDKPKPDANDTKKAEQPAKQKKAPAPEAQDADTITVYSARSAGLVEPLFELFEVETGLTVKARFDKSTQTLANRIAAEGKNTEADLFFAQDAGYLGALADAGHLRPLPEGVLSKVPHNYRHAQGQWVGTSGRARVLVYSPERVKPDELPKTLMELTDERWKGRIGWAPSNGSYQAHVSALRTIWGEKAAETWLKRIKALEPKVYPKNSPQVRAVDNGEIDIGWVNHYYLHKLKAANPELKAANHSFPTTGDAGNLMMVSGIAVTAHTKKKMQALKLVEFLLSKRAQRYFAEDIYEYPTVEGIKTSASIPPIGPQMTIIDQAKLSDVAGTVKMLRDVGLQ